MFRFEGIVFQCKVVEVEVVQQVCRISRIVRLEGESRNRCGQKCVFEMVFGSISIVCSFWDWGIDLYGLGWVFGFVFFISGSSLVFFVVFFRYFGQWFVVIRGVLVRMFFVLIYFGRVEYDFMWFWRNKQKLS